MFMILLVLLIVFVICCMEIFKDYFVMKEAEKFYETFNVGDVFWYISGPNVFEQPAEIITILEKKEKCVKWKLEIKKTGEVKEMSSTYIDFYEIYDYFNLKKQEK